MAGLVAKVPLLAEGLMKQAKPHVGTFMKYAKVELAPPTPGDIPKAFGGLRNVIKSFASGRYKQLTVREAWLNTLVGTEIVLWFFVGECIGKRSLIGYKV